MPPGLRPPSFPTPLWFDEAQLLELRGTALAGAAAAHATALRAQWERLQPALAQMLQRAGEYRDATFEDFLWAHSVFWSRAQGLPVPVREAAPAAAAPAAAAGPSGDALEGEEGEEGGGESGSDGAGGGAASGAVQFVVLEGVVPGLDFANHSTQVRGARHAVPGPGRWRLSSSLAPSRHAGLEANDPSALA
jgi:hypothetical protein